MKEHASRDMLAKYRFMDMNEIKEKNITPVVFCFGLFLIMLTCCILFFNEGKVREIDITEIPDNENIQYFIDSVVTTRHSITITGWVFLTEEEIKTFDCRFVLYDIKNQDGYIIPSQLIWRPDVEAAFNPNSEKRSYNYSGSGLVGSVMKMRLKKDSDNYKIYILYKNNDKFFIVDMNKYVYD
jgi:hypothetical protein